MHVTKGINMNRAAHAGHDQQHHEAQGIELQTKVDF